MATIKKTTLKSTGCKCSKEQLIFELSVSLDKSYIQLFNGSGFLEVKSYTNLGILYVESKDLTAIGPFGSNRLNIKCKTANCQNNILELEKIIDKF